MHSNAVSWHAEFVAWAARPCLLRVPGQAIIVFALWVRSHGACTSSSRHFNKGSLRARMPTHEPCKSCHRASDVAKASSRRVRHLLTAPSLLSGMLGGSAKAHTHTITTAPTSAHSLMVARRPATLTSAGKLRKVRPPQVVSKRFWEQWKNIYYKPCRAAQFNIQHCL